MKKTIIHKKKLTKAELKEISGGAIANCAEDLCKLRGVSSHFMIIGPRGRDGYCC
ncbi:MULTISPECIES: bacteriocin [Chryseobacterium]|uniref:Bacteriocin n=1 Tax=Chryseobacterium bernardetii TaxID=1241978 RepID=A0A3G6T493_9FLAO|nr:MULTISPECIES: bacteriocin [Chryseobacterium]AZB24172.1 bacteriocin [Chryseobacterium bernardetii]AZB34752.1 bacteriocin [Chryseobacterium bernardetii]UCA58564.1 bacteriocin [Chryseobacterium rhizoplanae]